MGGGSWNVSLDAGPLHAYYCAHANFLINFQPFYFVASGGLAVGVEFTLDLWLISVHISVDISAQLYMEGPPVHGYVHVNFWVFGFDVKFGDDSKLILAPLLLALLVWSVRRNRSHQNLFRQSLRQLNLLISQLKTTILLRTMKRLSSS